MDAETIKRLRELHASWTTTTDRGEVDDYPLTDEVPALLDALEEARGKYEGELAWQKTTWRPIRELLIDASKIPEGGASFVEMMRTLVSRLAALEKVRAAAMKVPIARVNPEPDGVSPWLTCKGCGSTDGEPCAEGCWVSVLDAALDAALKERDA